MYLTAKSNPDVAPSPRCRAGLLRRGVARTSAGVTLQALAGGRRHVRPGGHRGLTGGTVEFPRAGLRPEAAARLSPRRCG
jgi:hypothetical protein